MCSLFGILAKLVYLHIIIYDIQTTTHTAMQHLFLLFHTITAYMTICSVQHPRRLHFFSSQRFIIGRGPSQHTTRRHEGGGGGDASARHRCGLAVAGATRRHALGDTRRGGRPGAHPVPIARPRLSARIDPTFSRHPPLTLRPLSRSTGLPRRGGGDHDGRRHRHRCPRARHELAGG